MWDCELPEPGVLGHVALFLFALPVMILVSAAPAFAQAQGPVPGAPSASPTGEVLKNWRDNMARVPPPDAGCFTSSYPNSQWQEVPCVPAPAVPFRPARGPQPSTVGGGHDVSAQVTSGTISTAVGSFDSVTGVTSETGLGGTNDYSLQLNTNFFTGSPTCAGAANPSTCEAWQQFIYSSGGGGALMQYWLIGYNATCPSGWNSTVLYGETDCWMNGLNSVGVPLQIIANLGNLYLMGRAQAGGFDTIIMGTGSDLYAAVNSDSVVYLAQFWTAAEFNIVGDCCSSEATFNAGSTIVVRLSVEDSLGIQSAPSCLGQGFTGETNNLNFGSAPLAIRGTTPAIMFTESSSGSAPLACASATAVAGGWLVDTHDYNADGKSDIVWKNTSGDVVIWLMNGTAVLNLPSSYIATVSTGGWSIVGQHDFNGDGIADLLWRDTGGDTAIWFMYGTTVVSSAAVGNIPGNWTVVGVADFNGDGMADLLWRDSNGDLAVWLMNGAAVMSSAGIGNVPTTFTIAGTGDFNGNGMGDILWRDGSGNLSIWFMNGTMVSSAALVGNVPTSFALIGTGDFNGDGKTDIVWRDSAGNISVWLMNGASILMSGVIGNVTTAWSLALTGDFNGDGKSDLLWRDNVGDTAIWFMNGTSVASSQGIGNIPTSWTVQSLNAD